MAPYRCHVLGIPHTASNADWLCCAFTQKVVKLCRMLTRRGHHIMHYGNSASDVACAEAISVTQAGDLRPPSDYLSFDLTDRAHRTFHANAIGEIAKRKRPGDFLLCAWGAGHKPVADAHSDLLVVESGIGYAGGHFARFKAFESYAMLHAYYGLGAVARGDSVGWYDVVIPNYFDLDDFEFAHEKDDYLLFLGRVDRGKGVHIAIEIAVAEGMPLVIAGPGKVALPQGAHNITLVGAVDRDERRRLLSRARALLAPSTFIEPFCGVVTEAQLSGTPTITSDWGAFAETNLHGVTGYRCRTFEQFCWAARAVGDIDAQDCRSFAENFSLARVGPMYEEFFHSIANVAHGRGWYEPSPERAELDWLKRAIPA